MPCIAGYLIPKGWKVMPLFRNIHHNPEFFPDPHIFDPSRFEVCLYACACTYIKQNQGTGGATPNSMIFFFFSISYISNTGG